MIIYYIILSILSPLYFLFDGSKSLIISDSQHIVNGITQNIFNIFFPLIYGMLLLFGIHSFLKVENQKAILIDKIFLIINNIIFIICFFNLQEFSTYNIIFIGIIISDICLRLLSERRKK